MFGSYATALKRDVIKQGMSPLLRVRFCRAYFQLKFVPQNTSPLEKKTLPFLHWLTFPTRTYPELASSADVPRCPEMAAQPVSQHAPRATAASLSTNSLCGTRLAQTTALDAGFSLIQ
jgi:hypothetical protein